MKSAELLFIVILLSSNQNVRHPIRCILLLAKVLRNQGSNLNLLGKFGVHEERCACLPYSLETMAPFVSY